MKVTRLTKREADIMEIFWRSEKPLSSNDIHSLAPEISINTIQPNLRKLNEKGYIEVAGVGFTRNSITREYQPLITQADISAPFWMRRLLMRSQLPTLKNAMIRSGWKSSGSF
ncbi:MAG: BlaI/MecI/CopY family transcriptional regulator [Merdibacter sp.]